MRKTSLILLLALLMSASSLAAPPRPDPDMQQLLDTWSAFRGRPLETLSPAEARSQPGLQTAVAVLLRKQGRSVAPPSVARVYGAEIPGAQANLPVRVYQPAGDGPFPLLVYFHGGGWVLGGIDDYELSARALANAAGCVVVSVGYRQAPEHPYPAAVKDAQAAFSYISKNADRFNGDPGRVAVGGEGSGANLAAGVCLMAMDMRTRMPLHQLLICPITDATTERASYRQNSKARPFSRAEIQWFLRQYLTKSSDAKSPYVSIVRKSPLDLPPATVIVADLDPLRSDGEAYHKHLVAHAVDSQLGLYTGVTADFFGTGAVVAKARKAVDFAGRRLRKAFTLKRPLS